MGEPLKDKVKHFVKEPCYNYYKEDDIKSAVAWLKREVVMCRDDDERTKYDIDKILELINEAFPDIKGDGESKKKL